jgi:hypothetical protein
MTKGDGPRDRPAAKSSPAVVSDGTYKVAREVRWLRPPSEVKLEPVTEMIDPVALARGVAAEEEAEEKGPTPQELAQQEAEGILDGARQEAEELKRQAREQGYADGLKEGVEEGRTSGREEGIAELRDALDRWLTMGDALTEAWRVRFDGLEGDLKDLSVAVESRSRSQGRSGRRSERDGAVRDFRGRYGRARELRYRDEDPGYRCEREVEIGGCKGNHGWRQEWRYSLTSSSVATT